MLFPPFTGLDPLLYPAPSQGPLTLTPTITIDETYNDNVFLDNRDKRSDFITQISPGLALAMQQPGFNLTASYALTAEIYARETDLNGVNSHRFLGGLSYQLTPRVSLNLSDGLTYSQNSNSASVSGVSTGRGASLNNVLTAGATFQATQRLSWQTSGAYTIERFEGSGSHDSNTYRIGTGFVYTLTPRLDLSSRYDFEYFDTDGEKPSTTHTPRIGASYQITPTLSASVSAGPSFLVSDDETSVSPAVTANISKTMSWGSISAFYDRSFGTSGGLGGPSDVQTFGGSILVSTLLRGLVVSFSPRYTILKDTGASRSDTGTKSLTLNLSAAYQIARYVAVVAAYSYFQQRTDSGVQAADVDQNQVSLGLRFGYPINFY